jgi:hypothetical protein
MTDRIDAKITFNVTIHDQRALRRAAWKRAKEDRTTARDHAEFRRRVGSVEAYPFGEHRGRVQSG